MTGRTLILATFVAGVAGCALPLLHDAYFAGTTLEPAIALDTTHVTPPAPPPVVQVRDFPHSSVVSVLAWEPDDAQLGLRTSVTRTGKLFGGRDAGDHQLYLDYLEARRMGGFQYATVTLGHLLMPLGTRKDSQACTYGKVCTPMVASSVRIPDSTLRAHRDSLVVTFHPPTLRSWSVTLRKELITAYLHSVDSVVAAQR